VSITCSYDVSVDIVPIETTLEEYPVSENKALKHINLITTTRREVELVCVVLYLAYCHVMRFVMIEIKAV